MSSVSSEVVVVVVVALVLLLLVVVVVVLIDDRSDVDVDDDDSARGTHPTCGRFFPGVPAGDDCSRPASNDDGDDDVGDVDEKPSTKQLVEPAVGAVVIAMAAAAAAADAIFFV